MKKYNCATLEELEKKQQECYRNFIATRHMIDAAIHRKVLEYSNEVGIEMDKFAAQAREIEDAMKAGEQS